MSLMKWNEKQVDPWKELLDFSEPQWGVSMFPKLRQPLFKENLFAAVDVSEDEKSITVKADLPGLKKEEINISVEGTILTIKGERKYEEEQKKQNYHRVERSYGSFARSFDLGVTVEESKIKAQYRDGVLSVTIPKAQIVPAKQITVE